MVRHSDEGTQQPRLNWGLFLMLGLCVEFWIVAMTAVAHNI
jgi:hypothetical protein